jgi:hypothetical protein
MLSWVHFVATLALLPSLAIWLARKDAEREAKRAAQRREMTASARGSKCLNMALSKPNLRTHIRFPSPTRHRCARRNGDSLRVAADGGESKDSFTAYLAHVLYE